MAIEHIHYLRDSLIMVNQISAFFILLLYYYYIVFESWHIFLESIFCSDMIFKFMMFCVTNKAKDYASKFKDSGDDVQSSVLKNFPS